MSDIYFNIYVQNESLNFRIKDGIALDELASIISSFFESEENWHKMKECWLDGEPVCKIKRTDFGYEWPVKDK